MQVLWTMQSPGKLCWLSLAYVRTCSSFYSYPLLPFNQFLSLKDRFPYALLKIVWQWIFLKAFCKSRSFRSILFTWMLINPFNETHQIVIDVSPFFKNLVHFFLGNKINCLALNSLIIMPVILPSQIFSFSLQDWTGSFYKSSDTDAGYVSLQCGRLSSLLLLLFICAGLLTLQVFLAEAMQLLCISSTCLHVVYKHFICLTACLYRFIFSVSFFWSSVMFP